MKYPPLYQVRQKFDDEALRDVPAVVGAEVAKLGLRARCRPGQSVAITAGSRGIAELATILRTLVGELHALGLEPFIVPAMGSHGGGKADGQAKVLEKYGVTERAMGAPVRASMEVVQLGETEDGVPVVIDRLASEADWVVVVNRAKPHTRFRGEIESGLCKMMLIGLGKAEGAGLYHRALVQLPFDRLVSTAVPLILERANILFGLGIVENGYDRPARIEAARPERIIELDRELLADAKRRMPRLPFSKLEVVVIDWIGKNFSGTGMDTNIVGHKSGVDVTCLYARGLHPSSGGNATGCGYADMVHRRLAAAMDAKATYLNCLTARGFAPAKLPMVFETDREAIDAALTSIGLTLPEKARLCWIPNTLHLGEVWLSESLLAETEARPDLTVQSGPHPLQFDEVGDFTPVPVMFRA